jgi:hypothetical protein
MKAGSNHTSSSAASSQHPQRKGYSLRKPNAAACSSTVDSMKNSDHCPKSSSTGTNATTGTKIDTSDHEQQHRIHFLSALATVPVPFTLLTGMPIYTVSAHGKTRPATLTFSVDRFTAYIRHDPSFANAGGGGSTGNGHSNSSAAGGSSSNGNGSGAGGGLSRAPSEKSLLGSSLFALGFRDNANSHHHMNQRVEERAIDIGEMDRVQRGQSTQQFELAKKNVKADNKVLEVLYKKAELQRNSSTSSNSSLPSTSTMAIHKLDPSLSFSIIFRGAHTVDLMAQSEKDRNVICNTLDQILQSYQRAKNRVSTDILLLRYVWLEVDRGKTGYVSVQQFWQALQVINFNKKLKDVATDYEKFGRIIGLDKSDRKRGLSFEQSATFLHKVRQVFLIVINCEKGNSPSTDCNNFTQFIRHFSC